MVDFKNASGARKIANVALKFFDSRRGFDDWFDTLDKDVQREIKDGLTAAIYQELLKEKEAAKS